MKNLLRPFGIISKLGKTFITWLIMVIVIGQAGIIFSILGGPRFYSKDHSDWVLRLAQNFFAGNFYTFGIAILAGSLYTILEQILKNKTLAYKDLKICALALSIVMLLLGTLFFAHLQPHSYPTSAHWDWGQFLYYVAAIFVSTYLFCLCLLELDSSYKDLGDSEIERLRQNSKKSTSDGQGVSLE